MKVLWKEWNQQKWLVLTGSLAGITPSIFEYFNNRQFHPQINNTESGSAVVLACGVLFAIILSAASTHHDLKKGIDNFWQSKPLTAYKLFITKFLVASVLLFPAFLFVQSIDFITHSRQGCFPTVARAALTYTYPIALIMFSLTMFLMVIVRDTAKTVLFAIWAVLLIYFLPLLTNTLQWLNFFEVMDQPSRTPSIIDYLIWFTSLPKNIGHGVSINRLAWMPHNFYQVTDSKVQVSHTKNLWYIITSPEYLKYLLFVAFAVITSALSIFLTVKAIKNNWRWRPEQKTIAWTLGLSAAFIFGVAMVQVGHNLEPIKEWNGKKIVNPAVFDWSYMPASFKQGLPEGQFITSQRMYFDRYQDAVCIKDDLMFRVSCGYQGTKNEKPPKYDDEVIRHFVVQIYRFPYWDNSDIPVKEGMKQLPDFVAGAMRLFETGLVRRHENQQTLGCFVKENYLYIAYRPQIRTHKDNLIDLKNIPIYFATIDTSDPAKPNLIGNIKIEPTCNFCGGFANYGDYCYLSDGGQLVIISIAQAGKPEIIRQIPYIARQRRCNIEKKTEKNEKSFEPNAIDRLPSDKFTVVDDKLVCNNYNGVAVLDLTEQTNPRVIYTESFAEKGITQNQIQVAYKDDYLYIANNNGLYIRKLIKHADGTFSSELVGDRMATPIEKLAGRKPQELLFYKDYLVESSSGFGLIVYNVSDPNNPKRVYHVATQNNTSDVGIWNDLIYMQDYGFKVHFFDIPKTN